MWLRSWIAALAGLLLLQPTAAAPAFTNTAYNVEIDTPFTLSWVGSVGNVSICLVDASSPVNLKEIRVLAVGVAERSLTWTPNNITSGASAYVFKITDGAGEVVFSPTFVITGMGPANTTPRPTTATPTPIESRTSTTATPTSYPSPSATIPGNSPSANSSMSLPSDSHGLTTGAKAGVGVAAGIVALLGIAAIAFIFYRRGRVAGAKEADRNPIVDGGLAELGGTGIKPGRVELGEGGNEKPPLELGGKPMAETASPVSPISSHPRSPELGIGYAYYPPNTAELGPYYYGPNAVELSSEPYPNWQRG